MPPRKRSKPPRPWPGLDTRYPTRWKCQCGSPVLSGIHESWSVLLDPEPVSQFGELEALLTGRRTYILTDEHIYRRNRCSIARDPTGTWGNIHREHRCGSSAMQPASRRADTIAGESDDCPF